MKTRLLGAFLLICSAFFISCENKSKPADALIQRVTEGTVKNLKTEIIESKSAKDFFEISAEGNDVLIKGNSTVSIATGFNWYLKYVAKKHISWNNLTEKMPEQLPLPQETIRKETEQLQRYYLNYCTFSYSMPFWDWERWEKELDWMALHGINLPLTITGHEVVWYNLLKRNGYTVDEINEFISGPAFMAWWQMNNLEGWGGPNPAEWYEKQEALQKKILARSRELGMEPVVPGYAGMVPRNVDEKLGFSVSDPGTWCTFDRPAFLRTDDENFDKFADMYYEEVEKLFGKVKYYSMDPFHEGGSIEGIDLEAAGTTIMNAMKRANPEGVWVAQAWHANPRAQMIDHLEQGDLLVLDLYAEKNPQALSRKDGFKQHDWLYCMLLNFGGRVGLHGRIEQVVDNYFTAQEHASGKTLKGVGATMEAIENNPVMYELLYELPWRSEKFDVYAWLENYTEGRYGNSNDKIKQAWDILGKTAYNTPRSYRGEGPTETFFGARPGIGIQRASTWGDATMHYPTDETRKAVKLMLDDADQFKGVNNFEYDLVDVLRQSIADKANRLLGEITEAYKEKDLELFETLSQEFLADLLSQDELLATRKEFRVGNWIEQAKSLSDIPENKDLYEYNARLLITVWGSKSAAQQGGLHDYSNREWNGILASLYHKRWLTFFESKMEELRTGTPADRIDFYAMEEAWTKERNVFGSESEGDVIAVAKKVYDEVFGE